MPRPFVDNFIFFNSYPVEKLSAIVKWLTDNQLNDFYRNDDFSQQQQNTIIWYGTQQIVFPKYVFYNKNYTTKWQDFCTIIEPLVEFMQKQMSVLGEYQPWQVEINMMPPGTVIKPHIDNHVGVGEDYRVHIVISTNDAVEFFVDDKVKHFPQGTCFAFDNSKVHSVINNHKSLSRMHLVVDFKLRD
jgi:hypothetical protein